MPEPKPVAGPVLRFLLYMFMAAFLAAGAWAAFSKMVGGTVVYSDQYTIHLAIGDDIPESCRPE